MSNDDGLMMDMMLMIIIMLMDMMLMVMMTAIRWLMLVMMMMMIMLDMSAYAGDDSDENSAYEAATMKYNTTQHTVSVQDQYKPLGKGSPTQGKVHHLKNGNA